MLMMMIKNGLLTNDVRLFGEPVADEKASLVTPNVLALSARSLYAAMLTPQGRFLYDMFLYEPPRTNEKPDPSGSRRRSDQDEVVLLADVDCSVDIENVGEELCCWQRYGVDLHKRAPSDPEAASVGNTGGWQWHKDPRLNCLGFRGIFPSSVTRESIPLEYNFAGLNAISFDKGCYVGQELIARSHHRGVIRKRLLPLKFRNESGKEVAEPKVAPSSEVIASKSGKKVGIVTTVLGSRGLGLLRLNEAFKGPGNLVIKGQEDVKVEPIRPEWWPTEWFLEHEPHQAAG
ncbi:Glycine cleavage T-protein, C-terminal barrel [Cynara cardunculus var. scolymus]|uniref:Glycine cleavage T-protein, C-terminal barrel n=1 Tax=Cynara cardunculus var. scolymus TaxID=59895 RepID=A0A118JV96_CYNCS|nr:Glycine cleavage T-protein, C-terminal barrel [Cynara cardunculus var. scolymus]